MQEGKTRVPAQLHQEQRRTASLERLNQYRASAESHWWLRDGGGEWIEQGPLCGFPLV